MVQGVFLLAEINYPTFEKFCVILAYPVSSLFITLSYPMSPLGR